VKSFPALLPALLLLTLHFAVTAAAETTPPQRSRWIPLFNGRDLQGWTVKIAKHPLGENYADTFRVEDGMIKASYDKYSKFGMQFGHL
jgi:hypothetical protein